MEKKLTGKAESSFLNLWFFGHSWVFGRTVMDSEKETSQESSSVMDGPPLSIPQSRQLLAENKGNYIYE